MTLSAVTQICGAASRVNAVACYGNSDERDELRRTVAQLQQRVNALETELRGRQGLERLLAAQHARVAAMVSAQAGLTYLAGHDALTGLLNRHVFNDRLTHAIERATRIGSSLALVFIDIDNFKTLNDQHGHAVGDHLLKQVAARLSLCVREADTVCRWGGDEFVVITEEASAAQAGVLMQRIATALGETYVAGATSVAVSASVGLSRFPDDAADVQALLHGADTAMYQAKRAGKALRLTAPLQAMS